MAEKNSIEKSIASIPRGRRLFLLFAPLAVTGAVSMLWAYFSEEYLKIAIRFVIFFVLGPLIALWFDRLLYKK